MTKKEYFAEILPAIESFINKGSFSHIFMNKNIIFRVFTKRSKNLIAVESLLKDVKNTEVKQCGNIQINSKSNAKQIAEKLWELAHKN